MQSDRMCLWEKRGCAAAGALLMGSRGTFHLEMLKDLKVADISY